MFKPQTVFVVGAGASKDFKSFPVGSQLALAIEDQCQQLSQDMYARRQVNGHFLNRSVELDEAYRIIASRLYLANSIDSFLEQHQKNRAIVDVGKLLIAAEICKAERDSSLAGSVQKTNQPMDMRSLSSTWLEPFTRELFAGVHDPEVLPSNVSIICFNYDRCIEFYLSHAISQRYGLDYKDASSIVDDFEIIHPYGTLGPCLPTLPPDAALNHLPLHLVQNQIGKRFGR